MTAPGSDPDDTTTLAELVAGMRWRDLGEDAQRKLGLCLLVNLSVAAAGARYAYLPRARPTPDGVPLVDGGRAAPRDAAAWNTAVMHARTQDDFHPPSGVHVGALVVPAALAAGAAAGASGERLLDGIVAGYSVAAGVGRVAAPHTTPKGFRSTALYGPFGAAAGAAVAAGLAPEQCGHAVAFAAAWSAGLTQCWREGSDEWQVHVALAAQNGLLASELASGGLRAAPNALTGVSGFFPAVAGVQPGADFRDGFDPDRVIGEVVLKRHPVSGKCQAPVALLERMLDGAPVEPGDLVACTVHLHPVDYRHPGSGNRGPFPTVAAALMSIPFSLACVVRRGRLRLDDVYGLDDKDTHALLPRIALREDGSLPKLGCRIDLETKQARRTGQVLDVHGELALTWDSVDDFAAALWEEGGWPSNRYPMARRWVEGLPEAAGLGGLADLVERPGTT